MYMLLSQDGLILHAVARSLTSCSTSTVDVGYVVRLLNSILVGIDCFQAEKNKQILQMLSFV